MDAAKPSSEKPLAQEAQALLQELLQGMVEHRASDLHLRSNAAPIYRIDGSLQPVTSRPLAADLVKEALYHMISPRQRQIFEEKNDVDFSFAVPGLGRFRGNSFRQRGSVAIVLRQIPTRIPDFEELKL